MFARFSGLIVGVLCYGRLKLVWGPDCCFFLYGPAVLQHNYRVKTGSLPRKTQGTEGGSFPTSLDKESSSSAESRTQSASKETDGETTSKPTGKAQPNREHKQDRKQRTLLFGTEISHTLEEVVVPEGGTLTHAALLCYKGNVLEVRESKN
ncbi:hypothetical protein NDU88_002775 [Pleurodeles waltl]|uniref:Uncharacterized protein n=1 Tax=Pleurodeles waltl TaxID=8319 RepID=A0AAV7UZJ5_PLEWA|nr:hypothetical protein NDU88_002775 [Pleurodeles waltl]